MDNIFEKIGERYVPSGDYLIPDLCYSDRPKVPLGKYGRIPREVEVVNMSLPGAPEDDDPDLSNSSMDFSFMNPGMLYFTRS